MAHAACQPPPLCVPGCAVPPTVSVLGFGAQMSDVAYDEPVPGERLAGSYVIGPSQVDLMPVPPGPSGLRVTGAGVYSLVVHPHGRDVLVTSAPVLPGLPIEVPRDTCVTRHLAVPVDSVPVSLYVLARYPEATGTLDLQLTRIGVLTF